MSIPLVGIGNGTVWNKFTSFNRQHFKRQHLSLSRPRVALYKINWLTCQDLYIAAKYDTVLYKTKGGGESYGFVQTYELKKNYDILSMIMSCLCLLWAVWRKDTAGYRECTAMEKDVAILTHWGLVTPYGDNDLGQHWLWLIISKA